MIVLIYVNYTTFIKRLASRLQQVTTAEEIDRNQYLQLKNKAYLTLTEKYSVERFRISNGYEQSVTEELVKKDKGGAYLGQLINLEAVLSPAQAEVVDSTTGKKRLLPPEIVIDKDKWELDNLPFLPDRQHHCTQWLMWQTLGLPKILSRLFAGEEYKADDPDLVKLAETAMSYRDNIKTILGFWIPDNFSPTWLLGMLVQKLGLKTASRKKGSNGTQVKYYSLAVPELALATQVLEYRHEQRIKREERKRDRTTENRLYQIMLQTQYGITPNSISTPDQNSNFTELQQGVDMVESHLPRVLDRIQPAIKLWAETVNLGLEVIEGLIDKERCQSRVRNLLIMKLTKLNI